MKAVTIFLSWFSLFMALSQCLSCSNTDQSEQEPPTSSFIDVEAVRDEIEAIGRAFCQDFYDKDSVALAGYYATDGMFGSVQGRENLISAWDNMIGIAGENGTPNLSFLVNSLTSDDEYVVDLGTYKYFDNDGNIGNYGKYVLIWKQEGGKWKVYRDWGL